MLEKWIREELTQSSRRNLKQHSALISILIDCIPIIKIKIQVKIVVSTSSVFSVRIPSPYFSLRKKKEQRKSPAP